MAKGGRMALDADCGALIVKFAAWFHGAACP